MTGADTAAMGGASVSNTMGILRPFCAPRGPALDAQVRGATAEFRGADGRAGGLTCRSAGILL